MNRAARGAIALAIGYVPPFLLWLAVTTTGDGEAADDLIAVVGIVGTPVAVATAILVSRSATAAHGRDAAARLLNLATAGLRGTSREWGAAMRAELASIDDPRERRRFALGCAWAAVRAGTGPVPWLVALAIGVLFAAGTYEASRASLAEGRGGIVGLTLPAPIVVLFALGVAGAFAARSFRFGLVTGALAVAAGLVGVLGTAVVEAAHWYEVAGVFVMDGDAPADGLDYREAVLDPISPSFVLIHLLFWCPWVVLGAAAGSWLRRRATPAGRPASLGALIPPA